MSVGFCQRHREKLWQDAEFSVALWEFLLSHDAVIDAHPPNEQQLYWHACLEVIDAMQSHGRGEAVAAFQHAFARIMSTSIGVRDIDIECRLHDLANALAAFDSRPEWRAWLHYCQTALERSWHGRALAPLRASVAIH